MAKSEITCAYCKKKSLKENGVINRARSSGSPIFCSRTCAGMNRRVERADEEKKKLKAEYDKNYRATSPTLKARKAKWYKENHDREKEREYRKTRVEHHNEYCRRPEYVAKKKEYDRIYRAKTRHGEYWESFLLTQDIRNECINLQSDYEIRLNNGTLNKSQKRKRACQT